MADIILGRETYCTVRTVTCANGVDTPIVGPAEDRIAIFFASSAVGVRIAPNDADGNGFGSFTIGAALAPVKFDIKTDGMIVCTNWHGAGQGGAFNVLVIETFLSRRKE
jgi:hypothetical protein